MEIYLPKGGDWIDYWNHDVYLGEGIITYDTSDINKLPIFIKAGAIIANRQEMDWIDTAIEDQITFDIFPSAASSFDFYEDDNLTLAYQNGRIAKTTLNVTTDNAGNVTKTRQPTFLVNVNGDSVHPNLPTGVTIINFGSEAYDVGNNVSSVLSIVNRVLEIV
jgi:alpha-glucosidase (family GH31 glycosyl hydrolase)